MNKDKLTKDVNGYSANELEVKYYVPKTTFKNAFSSDDSIKICDNIIGPELQKQKNMESFEIRNNYIILAKGNGDKRYMCSICKERHAGTGNIKLHLLKRHNYVGPPKPFS